MAQALNTTVNGSDGSCREAANYLAKIAKAAHGAADAAQQARTVDESSWSGPARDAHDATTQRFGPSTDRLGEQAEEMERALREFADSLGGVIRRMDNARGKASLGGLKIEGPFIFAPEQPVAANVVPTGPCGGAEAREVMAQNKEAIVAHNAAVTDYNAKAAVYNECKAIVTDARNQEGNAHNAVQQVFQSSKPEDDYVALGFTTASHSRGFVASMENSRLEYSNLSDRFRNTGADFTNFALGKFNQLPENFQKTLVTYISATNAGAEYYQAKANEYGRYVNGVPQWARDVLSSYPGKGAMSNPEPGVGKVYETARSYLKGLSYIGSGLVVANEVRGAVKGEQSWGKAISDTGVIIAASAAGGAGAGWAYGALVGSVGGPVGALVVGTAGGMLGGIAGQWVADIVNPE
ncbi:hypothetical protein [Prauserella cavernicola]|uniref:Uncharacterized protein n=1 Tax=Prauserella cavernicola TaxID=2800127 RepID=A0A934QRN0_9PSEU|nr:hypothetical protein [Prauserella cavernicola]MBK1784429.1 hypothetical protein [Prauserella cavernicola]